MASAELAAKSLFFILDIALVSHMVIVGKMGPVSVAGIAFAAAGMALFF